MAVLLRHLVPVTRRTPRPQRARASASHASLVVERRLFTNTPFPAHRWRQTPTTRSTTTGASGLRLRPCRATWAGDQGAWTTLFTGQVGDRDSYMDTTVHEDRLGLYYYRVGYTDASVPRWPGGPWPTASGNPGSDHARRGGTGGVPGAAPSA
ncbi:hypothetical protein ACFQ0G_25120 [Streptomyces chiangmaiensis]